MKSSPYLFFNGNCEEAFAFYGRTLGTKPAGSSATPATRSAPTGSVHLKLTKNLPTGQTVRGSIGTLGKRARELSKKHVRSGWPWFNVIVDRIAA